MVCGQVEVVTLRCLAALGRSICSLFVPLDSDAISLSRLYFHPRMQYEDGARRGL